MKLGPFALVWRGDLTFPIRVEGHTYTWTGLAVGNWGLGLLRRRAGGRN